MLRKGNWLHPFKNTTYNGSRAHRVKETDFKGLENMSKAGEHKFTFRNVLLTGRKFNKCHCSGFIHFSSHIEETEECFSFSWGVFSPSYSHSPKTIDIFWKHCFWRRPQMEADYNKAHHKIPPIVSFKYSLYSAWMHGCVSSYTSPALQIDLWLNSNIPLSKNSQTVHLRRWAALQLPGNVTHNAQK